MYCICRGYYSTILNCTPDLINFQILTTAMLARATGEMTTQREMKHLLHSFCHAAHACWACLHHSAQTQKNITVYFIFLYFHTRTYNVLCVFFFVRKWHWSLLSSIHHTNQVRVLLLVETQARSGCTVPNRTVLYCPTKAKDLNSLECETEKNDFKVFYLSSQINYR